MMSLSFKSSLAVRNVNLSLELYSGPVGPTKPFAHVEVSKRPFEGRVPLQRSAPQEPNLQGSLFSGQGATRS